MGGERGVGQHLQFQPPPRRPQSACRRRPRTPAPASNRPLVAIVEDDRRSLDLLSLYVADAGAEVVTAEDGRTGLELVRRLHPAAVISTSDCGLTAGLSRAAQGRSGDRTNSRRGRVHDRRAGRRASRSVPRRIWSKPAGRGRGPSGPGPGGGPARAGTDRRLHRRRSSGSRADPNPLSSRKGGRYSSAVTGDEGIELTRSRLPAVVLLDLFIAGMGGLAVAEAIRADEVTSAIPIILLTSGDLTPEDKERPGGRLAYAAGHGEFDPSALVELVGRATRALAPSTAEPVMTGATDPRRRGQPAEPEAGPARAV